MSDLIIFASFSGFFLNYFFLSSFFLSSFFFFPFFFAIPIIVLTHGNSEKQGFFLLRRGTLNFLHNWFDQYETNRGTEVLILIIGALHLWGFKA